jgi:hypothetical protein
MNKQNRIIFLLALALIVLTGLSMHRLKTHQKLGLPGIKTDAIPGSQRLDVYLPAHVLDYESEIVPTDTNVLNGLPQDTSFMQRRYVSYTRTQLLLLNVVLMGTDRTSIHKPQFCLTGQGWNIDGGESATNTVRVESPHSYDLPVMKLVSTREEKIDDRITTLRGIYVYWFVADHDLTADHLTRMWRMTTHLLGTGELERWAYVSCFAVCRPGQEDATYGHMKEFIAAAVPQFQLATGAPMASRAPEQTASR